MSEANEHLNLISSFLQGEIYNLYMFPATGNDSRNGAIK